MSTIRVTNVPQNIATETVVDLFSAFGTILSANQANNYIDLQFQEIADSQEALDNMTGYKLGDRYLQVSKVKEHNSLDRLEAKKAIWDQDHEMNV